VRSSRPRVVLVLRAPALLALVLALLLAVAVGVAVVLVLLRLRAFVAFPLVLLLAHVAPPLVPVVVTGLAGGGAGARLDGAAAAGGPRRNARDDRDGGRRDGSRTHGRGPRAGRTRKGSRGALGGAGSAVRRRARRSARGRGRHRAHLAARRGRGRKRGGWGVPVEKCGRGQYEADRGQDGEQADSGCGYARKTTPHNCPIGAAAPFLNLRRGCGFYDPLESVFCSMRAFVGACESQASRPSPVAPGARERPLLLNMT
jgi:hypothetical protein